MAGAPPRRQPARPPGNRIVGPAMSWEQHRGPHDVAGVHDAPRPRRSRRAARCHLTGDATQNPSSAEPDKIISNKAGVHPPTQALLLVVVAKVTIKLQVASHGRLKRKAPAMPRYLSKLSLYPLVASL